MAANPFAESTVGGLLDAVAARPPDGEAIVFGDERTCFAELGDRSLTLARGCRRASCASRPSRS